MLEVTRTNYDEVTKSGVTVLDFWAAWCGPCKMQSPVFEAVAKAHENITFGKVNVDEQSELAEQFQIMSIPTIVFLKDGEVVKRVRGYQTEENLEYHLEQFK